MQSLAAFALRGRPQALAVICGLAFASLLFPPLSLLSSAALSLVALRLDIKESAWILLLALLVLGMAGALSGSVREAVFYGALLWLPMWPVAVVLRASRRLEWAMTMALGLGLASVLGVYLLVDEPAALWRDRMQSLLRPMLENAPAGFDSTNINQALAFFAHYMTGAMAGGSMMSLLLALLIARWQQAVLYNPGGFRNEFIALRLQPGVAYAALACLVGGSVGGSFTELAWNLGIVFFMVFTLAGFAIFHAVLGGKGFWLAGIYVALLFMPQLLLPPIALIGFGDAWFDWRKYAKRF